MKKSICHYSLHRMWRTQNWTCLQLAEHVKSLGCEGIDFHAGLMGSTAGAAQKIREALKKTGLTLSGFSLGNNFNQEDTTLFKEQVDTVKAWLEVAAEVKAPVSRIFGGHIKDRSNQEQLQRGFELILAGLGQVVKAAEKLGVVLALENHGGLPCTGEEQVDVIQQINSKNLRATVDVGNYLQGGQEAHVGSAIAAAYCSYVHFKDFRKTPSQNSSLPWGLQACIVGTGDVDHLKCLTALKKAGYNGFVALEYEGPEDEKIGVPQSLEFMNKVMKGF